MKKAKAERLSILVEEAAEVIHVAMKIQRHGEQSYNPYDTDKTPNIELLEEELGHLLFAIDMMTEEEDLREYYVLEAKKQKIKTVSKYLHYNKLSKAVKNEKS